MQESQKWVFIMEDPQSGRCIFMDESGEKVQAEKELRDVSSQFLGALMEHLGQKIIWLHHFKQKSMCECSWPNCNYRCDRACDMKVHMRSHTGVRPYVCFSCRQPFTTNSNLRRHERGQHPED